MLTDAIAPAGGLIEVFGVGLIAAGVVIATALSMPAVLGHRHRGDSIQAYKARLARAMLLGLEVLVAAGIVKSVALEPSISAMGAVALLVLVRATLSWSLALEVNGGFPWRSRRVSRRPKRSSAPTTRGPAAGSTDA